MMQFSCIVYRLSLDLIPVFPFFPLVNIAKVVNRIFFLFCSIREADSSKYSIIDTHGCHN